jgi:hypothetical protein
VKAPIIDKVVEKAIIDKSSELEEFEEVTDEHGNLVKRKKGLGSKIKGAFKSVFGGKSDDTDERLR